jgi:predicted nucleic acid-binding Zn ribbon protein
MHKVKQEIGVKKEMIKPDFNIRCKKCGSIFNSKEVHRGFTYKTCPKCLGKDKKHMDSVGNCDYCYKDSKDLRLCRLRSDAKSGWQSKKLRICKVCRSYLLGHFKYEVEVKQ